MTEKVTSGKFNKWFIFLCGPCGTECRFLGGDVRLEIQAAPGGRVHNGGGGATVGQTNTNTNDHCSVFLFPDLFLDKQKTLFLNNLFSFAQHVSTFRP